MSYSMKYCKQWSKKKWVIAWWKTKTTNNRTVDILRRLGPLFQIIICRMYNMWALRDALENVRKQESKRRTRGVAWEELQTKVKALNERENSGGSCTAAASGHQMFVSSLAEGVGADWVPALGLTGFRSVVREEHWALPKLNRTERETVFVKANLNLSVKFIVSHAGLHCGKGVHISRCCKFSSEFWHGCCSTEGVGVLQKGGGCTAIPHSCTQW